MAVFAITLRQPNTAVWRRLASEYSDRFELSPTFAVVASKDTSGDVAEKIGLRGSNRIAGTSGVVVRLTGAYSGHTNPYLWEWFSDHKGQF